MDSRGNNTIFRNNTITQNVGAGVRLGGDSLKDGINNDVYNNTITNNQGGTLKIMRLPQGKICGNSAQNNDDNDMTAQGIDPTAWCK